MRGEIRAQLPWSVTDNVLCPAVSENDMPTAAAYQRFIERLATAIGSAPDIQSIAIAVGALRAKADRLDELRATVSREAQIARGLLPSTTAIDDLARGVEDDTTEMVDAIHGVRDALSAIESACKEQS